MENSQSLTATESFSYSWLIDRKPSSVDGFLGNFTPRVVEKEENFNFDVPVTAFPVSLVHADEIFSNGHIMPLFVDRSNPEMFKKTSVSTPPSPVSSSRSTPFVVDRNQYNHMLGKWRKSSKRILQKCLGFMKPLSKTIGCSRKSSRVDDLERKFSEIQSRGDSLETSPRPSSAYSVVEWDEFKKIGKKVDRYYGLKKVKSLNSSRQSSPRLSPSNSSNAVESSIHEAILYCKRSIGTRKRNMKEKSIKGFKKCKAGALDNACRTMSSAPHVTAWLTSKFIPAPGNKRKRKAAPTVNFGRKM